MNSKIFFQAISRPNLVDDVVIQLQKKISQGELQYGDKIPTEPELMKQFGVGRSTVREAVRVLVHAGLLEKRQGFGTFLSTTSVIQEPLADRLRRAEILEVYAVRKMLEIEISRLAAEQRDELDLEAMRSHLNQSMLAWDSRDITAYIKADIAFHLALAMASKNNVIVDLYRTFSAVLKDALEKLVRDKEVHNPNRQIHENIYQAIKDKDTQAAVSWTLQNLDGTVAELKKSLNKE